LRHATPSSAAGWIADVHTHLSAQTQKPPFYKDKANLLYYLDDKGQSVP